jgi:hypothetical protein
MASRVCINQEKTTAVVQKRAILWGIEYFGVYMPLTWVYAFVVTADEERILPYRDVLESTTVGLIKYLLFKFHSTTHEGASLRFPII